MADFSQLYTGKGGSVVLPSGEGMQKSQERLSDFIIKAEELKYNTYRENAKEFQKNALIEPEFVLAKSARDNTAKAISEFNNKWGKLFASKASTGGLTDDEKLQMATDKAWIQKENQNDLATMQKYQSVKQAVISNPTKYDADEFMLAEAKYINEGKFDMSVPPIKATSPTNFYNDKQNQFNNNPQEPVINIIKGSGQQYTTRYGGTLEDGKEKVRLDMLGNDDLRKGYIQEFQQLKTTNPDLYKSYLDVNKDNVISPQEASDMNPIIKWAQDTYAMAAIGKENSMPKTIPGSTLGGNAAGNVFSTAVVGNTAIKYVPTEGRPVQIGNLKSQNYHEYQKMPAINIAVTSKEGIDVLTEGMTDTIDIPLSFNSVLLGYDEDSDKYVFLVNKDFKDIGISGVESGGGIQIAVPRTSLEPGFFSNKLEVLKNGRKVVVGQLQRPEVKKDTLASKLTLPAWRKVNPTGTIQEYNAYLNGK